jgi:hypothetical protein
LICRSREYVGRCSSRRPASSASGRPARRYRPQAGPTSDKSAVNLVGACPLTQQRVQAPGYFSRDAGLDARDLGGPLHTNGECRLPNWPV